MLRQQAITLCISSLDHSASTETALALANSVVDQFYDRYAREERSITDSNLATSCARLRTIVADRENSGDAAAILSQLASLLRCQAQRATRQLQPARFAESLRCAERAVELDSTSPVARLALGQAQFNSARGALSDKAFFSRMKRAETAFEAARNGKLPIAILAASSFYRHSYRPAEAVKAFLDYESAESNRRRVLRESYLLAESAMQLWYNEYPEPMVTEAIDAAERCLSEAIDSGYQNARLFVDLALVQAAQGHIERSSVTLDQLSLVGETSWTETMRAAATLIDNGERALLSTGFALGVGDAFVWNSLGTYALRFLRQPETAERLYAVGQRIDPANAVIQTNLARVLINKGDATSLQLALGHLKRAAYNADRTFVWWRHLRSLAQKNTPIKKERGAKSGANRGARSFKALQDDFDGLLSGAIAGASRGRTFQALFTELLDLAYGPEVVWGSHVVRGLQVDAGFKHNTDYYRVETKWESAPCGPAELHEFAPKLNTAGVRGLFVSMSGFTDGAVASARRIAEDRTLLLVDGEDVRRLFRGEFRVEQMLERKLAHFIVSAEPFVPASTLDGSSHPA